MIKDKKTMYNVDVSETSIWFKNKYWEWQVAQGGQRTQKEFADYLGVKYTSLSNWMNADVPPTGRNLERVAAKLGDEIYDLLGLPRPTPWLREIAATLAEMSPEDQEKYGEQLLGWLRANTKRK